MKIIETKSSGKLERRSRRIETAKNLFEIIAIFIGACWALYIFSLKDFPNLNKAFKINGVIHVDEIEKNPKTINLELNEKCDLNFRIDLKNISYNDLTIDSVNTAVWIIPIDSVSLDSSYLYFEKLMNNDNSFHPFRAFTHYSKGTLCGYYPPDTEGGNDFDFIIPKTYDSAVMASFVVYFHAKKNFFWTQKFETSGYSWKLQCIPDKKEKEEVTKKDGK